MHGKTSNSLEAVLAKRLVISYFLGGKKCLDIM